MTDLQLGLVLAGAAVVAGVLAYNRLQERAVRRRAERAFGGPDADALLDEPGGRREPTLGAAPARAAEPAGEAALHERADYVIRLTAAGGIARPLLRELWAPIQMRFARRAFLSAPGGAEARAALQLVSRDGVVSDAELIEFRSAVETLAVKLGAAVSAPEMRGALEAARELDQACAEADIQVALHVVGVPPSSQVDEPAFQVAPRADGVTFTLDVARTPDPARAYASMARAGLRLAAAGGGRLVDDKGNPLDERSLAAIGAQLDAVRALLAGRGIEPGSPLALRLFS